ncbi:hypothetical protein FH972_025883 [Carpinus fangiana]|uniref:Uncharacterized protein n=1 Tax=Carpinus fangiana TaxID=176857 RepID=A0A5N6L2K4_9ROSI|nr:hypothetical protein FH972_025883 [Carpinus fangiana]
MLMTPSVDWTRFGPLMAQGLAVKSSAGIFGRLGGGSRRDLEEPAVPGSPRPPDVSAAKEEYVEEKESSAAALLDANEVDAEGRLGSGRMLEVKESHWLASSEAAGLTLRLRSPSPLAAAESFRGSKMLRKWEVDSDITGRAGGEARRDAALLMLRLPTRRRRGRALSRSVESVRSMRSDGREEYHHSGPRRDWGLSLMWIDGAEGSSPALLSPGLSADAVTRGMPDLSALTRR